MMQVPVTETLFGQFEGRIVPWDNYRCRWQLHRRSDSPDDGHAARVALRAVVHQRRPPHARSAALPRPSTSREHDWEKVRELIEEDNLLQARTRSSGRPARPRGRPAALRAHRRRDRAAGRRHAVRARPPHVGRCLSSLRPHRRVRRGGPARAVPPARLDAATTRTSTASSGARRCGTTSSPTIKDSTLQKLRSNVFKMLRGGRACCRRRAHHACRAVRRASPTCSARARRATSASSRQQPRAAAER